MLYLNLPIATTLVSELLLRKEFFSEKKQVLLLAHAERAMSPEGLPFAH